MRNKKTQTQTPPSIRVELESEKQFIVFVESEKLEAVVRGQDLTCLAPLMECFCALHVKKSDFSLN